MTHIPTHPPDQTEEQRKASFASANIPLPPITPEVITSNDLQATQAPVITPVEVPEVPIVPAPDKEAPIEPTPTSTDVLFGEVESAIEGVTGFDREAGITQRTQSQQRRLIEINKQISLRQARNIKEVEAAKVSGRTTQFGAIASQKVRRTQAIESLELSAERAAITGELILARQLAGDAVDAKFAEQESNLNTQRANLISNFDSFTKAQQKQAEALLLQIDGDLKAIESQKENQKSIEGEVNLAASFGATSEQMEDIRNSATQAEAIGKRTEAGLVEAEALKTQVVEVGGRKLLVNTQTGATIKDLGAADVLPRTAADLTPFERLSTRNLAVEIFGKKGGRDPINISLIQDLTVGGMTIDEIKDNLRFEGQSTEFSGTIRDAAESIGFGMTAEKQERFFNSIDRSLEDDDIVRVKEVLIKGAIDTLGTDQAKRLRGDQRAVELFEEIASELAEFEAKGGETGIFKGTKEKVAQKIGRTTDPELARIANKIQIGIQKYRQAVSGLAFTESEAVEYRDIFSSISKTKELNTAKLESATDVLSGNVDFTLSSIIGGTAFEELFGENEPTGNIADDINQLSDEQRQILEAEGLI